jgi:hypothetical protein
MRFRVRLISATLLAFAVSLIFPAQGFSQDTAPAPVMTSNVEVPDAPRPQAAAAAGQTSTQQAQATQGQTSANPSADATAKHVPPPQPKRILGIMPNYRAVSAGTRPPLPTPKVAFKVATENSFDYSAFIFTGITSLLAEGTDAHTQLGKGLPGFGRYYWRGFVDKTSGNYMVVFVMPTLLHQDERYYAMGEGGFWKRGIYSATRILITPNYHGKNTFNTSEIVGRGISQAISLSYYPSKTQTLGGFSEKYTYALGRDALTNVFREFWPDINKHVLHHRHKT